jgi:hypothetical protein
MIQVGTLDMSGKCVSIFFKTNFVLKKMLQVGIEPTTTASHAYIYLYKSNALPTELLELWLLANCLQWESNPRPTVYKTGALPLSYEGWGHSWWGSNPRFSARGLFD